jgi:hypothetical protein
MPNTGTPASAARRTHATSGATHGAEPPPTTDASLPRTTIARAPSGGGSAPASTRTVRIVVDADALSTPASSPGGASS